MAHLKAKGAPVGLSAIGSAVKRPATVDKLTKFIKDRPQLFKVGATKQRCKSCGLCMTQARVPWIACPGTC